MTSCRLYILSACLMLTPLYVAAQTQPGEPQPAATPEPEKKTSDTAPAKKVDPELQMELGWSYEHLTDDRPPWQTFYYSLNRKFSSGQTLYATASATRRFELTDPSFMVGFVQPLTESRRWSATFEVSGSPTYQVLPKVSLFAQLERDFGKGWLGHAALRHTRYASENVNMGVFGVERYFKSYRAAYNMYVATLKGKGTSASHLFQANHYYGERNSVGLGFSFGEEIESVPEGLIRTDVLDFSLIGRHWINKKWGVSYGAIWHRQGTLYTRSGGQIGLLLNF